MKVGWPLSLEKRRQLPLGRTKMLYNGQRYSKGPPGTRSHTVLPLRRRCDLPIHSDERVTFRWEFTHSRCDQHNAAPMHARQTLSLAVQARPLLQAMQHEQTTLTVRSSLKSRRMDAGCWPNSVCVARKDMFSCAQMCRSTHREPTADVGLRGGIVAAICRDAVYWRPQLSIIICSPFHFLPLPHTP